MHLAPVFNEPHILLDPYGRLEALGAAVKPGFLRRHHVQRRLAQALFQLLLVRTAAQGIIENDGGEEARASSRIGYRRLLAALGIDGDEPQAVPSA
jgi:hypothetical protein